MARGGGARLGERSLLGLYDAGAVTAVAIDGDSVASGGRDGWLRMWRVPEEADVDDPALPPEGLPLQPRGAAKHPNVVTAVVIDPKTNTVWTTCLDGFVRRWDASEGGRERQERSVPEEEEGEEEAFSGETDDASGATDEDAATMRLAGRWRVGQPALCAAMSAEDRVVYVGVADGRAFAFDAGAASRDWAALAGEAGTGG